MCDARARALSDSRPRRTLPASCGNSPAMHSNSVVFPAPLGPISPSTSPSRIVSDTSDSAVSRPYDFVSRSTRTDTSGADMGALQCTGPLAPTTSRSNPGIGEAGNRGIGESLRQHADGGLHQLMEERSGSDDECDEA